MRADEMLGVGDLDGQAVWKAILKAVNELVNKESDGTVFDDLQSPLLATSGRYKGH